MAGNRLSDSIEFAMEQDRRAFLRALAGTGAVGLAGCQSSDDAPTPEGANPTETEASTGEGNQSGARADQHLSVMGPGHPDKSNFNMYGKQAFGAAAKILYEVGAKWYANEEKWIPVIVEGWEYPSTISEGSTVQFTLYDEFSWINGDNYTAKDFTAQLRLRREMNDAVFDFISDFEQTGTHTVELTFAQKINKRLFENAMFGMGDAPQLWSVKHDVYNDYITAIENAETDEEVTKAKQELNNWMVKGPKANELGLGNGPFKFKRVGASRMVLEKNEHYSNPQITADDIEFDLIETVPVASPQEKVKALKNNNVDAIHNGVLSGAQRSSVPDYVDSVTYYTHSGGAYCFNCRRAPFDNRKVRYALSHVWEANHDILLRNLYYADENKERVDYSVGMSNPLIEEYLGDRLDDYMKFDGGEEKAAELLRGEGFTKKDGTWYEPNGDQFTIDFPAATFHKNRTQTGAKVLSNFGIKTNPIIQEGSTWFGKTIANRDYDLTNWWVGQSVALPYQGYQGTLVGSAWVTAYPKGVPSVSEWKGQEATSEFVIKAPEIGNPEGSLREVNINELLSSLASAQTKAEKKPYIQELAWIWNWMDTSWGPWLLYLASEFYTTKNWEWPEKKSPIMQAPTVQDWPLRTGWPKPKSK